MKIQIIFVTILIIIFCSIYCDLKKPISPQFGNLAISLIFPEDAGMKLEKTTIAIDRVHIKIINSSNQIIVNNDLAKSGAVFTGDFEVASGVGYAIEIDCYRSSALIFKGNATNVSVSTGKTTPVYITLYSTVQMVKIYPSSIILQPNGTQQFNAYAFFPPHDDSINVTSEANWIVNPNSAGSFSSFGLYTASDNYLADAAIYASYLGKQGQASVTISGVVNLTNVTISPQSASLNNGDTLQFDCIAYYSDGSNQNVTSSATWSIDSTNAGSFLSPGSFKASDTYVGNATIYASYEDQQDQASVTINKIITSVDVTPSSATMNNAETNQFTCTAYYSDGSNQNVTSSATWSVNPTNAGSFSNPGLFSASNTYAGNATITASYSGKQDQASITINKIVASLDSVAITPSIVSLDAGETKQFTCTAYYSDGSNQNVTSFATWSVIPTNAGSFSSPGLFKVSDTYAGNSTITASYHAKHGTALINTPNSITLIISPESWDYGTVTVGQSSDKSFTIKNSLNSTATLSVSNQSIIGTHASEYSIVSGAGSFNLASGQSHTTTVRFISQKTGTKSATFTIENNSNNAPIKEVILSGYGLEFEMIYIPPGEFIMGSNTGAPDEKPVHSVYLDAYYIDKYEVTNSQYAAFLNDASALGEIQVYNKTVYKAETPLLYMHAEIGYDGVMFNVDIGKEYYPVVRVTWYGANAYAAHYGKRLPTEAEWEKAARSSDQRKYPWGNTEPTPLHCNYNLAHTTPVGYYNPNGDSPYGCSDMAGNVSEWCNDWYDRDYYSKSPSSNPQGPVSGDSRIIRGGSWGSGEYSVRSAKRDEAATKNGDSWTGFRCVR